MKKALVSLLLASCAFSASACTVYFSTASDVVRKVVRTSDGWAFDDYDAICEKLREAGVELAISGDATVLGGRSIGWAAVSLKDRKLNIQSLAFGGSSTRTNDYASMDKAEVLLFEAINQAINSVDFDKALAALRRDRAQIRSAFQAKASS